MIYLQQRETELEEIGGSDSLEYKREKKIIEDVIISRKLQVGEVKPQEYETNVTLKPKENEANVTPTKKSEDTPKTHIFCNECGHRNPASSKFCSNCGSKLDNG
jgi:zinc-ribbon domain